MKRLLLILLILITLPTPTFAFLDSANFVAASNQYFSAVDSASLSVTSDNTLSGWFYFASLPPTNNAFTLYGKWVDATSQDDYLWELSDSGGVRSIRLLATPDGTSVGLATVGWTPTLNTWYYLRATYTASTHTLQVFVDGVSQGSSAGTLPTSIHNGTSEFDIGINNATGQPFDGKMFMVRLWSNVHSVDTDKCTALGSTANLSGEWTLDNTLADNSGNGNTLTAHNSPTFTANIPAACAVVAPTFNPWQFFGL